MPFNVPPDQQPEFNKKVKGSLELLNADVTDKLRQIELESADSLVEAYNQPISEAELTQVPPSDMVTVDPQMARRMEIDSLRMPDGTIYRNANELFSQPLNADRAKAVGLVDTEGNATPRGELFFNLKESGVFNEDGTINEKGQAYLTPIADIGKEENLKAFQILWDDEVIRPNATFGEIASNTGKFVVDAALGGATRIGQEAQSFWHNSQTWDSALGRTDLRPQELRDKMTASGLGLVEGAVENLAGWAGIADIGSAWIGKKLYDVLPDGMENEAEQALYAARQRQWQTQQNIVNLSTGEIAEAVLGMDNAVAEAESAKSRIGKEEFDKQYGQTSAFSQLALDPTNAIPASIAVKAARTAPLANRVAITAQKRMASIAAQDLAIAEAQTAIEAANAVLKKEAATVSVANRLAFDISTRAGASPELVARANQASQVASRISDSANQIRATLPTVTTELESLVAKRNSLATRIPEAYSQKVLQTMELGRQMRSMPAKAVGATLERVGDTISKTDTAVTNFLQERGLDQMYTAAVGAAGVVGLAGNPIIGALGAGAAALKTGKVLSNYGKLFRYVGKEMENVRAQMPFWKRVARHTAPGSLSRGFAHTFNMLDLGGVTSDTIRRAGRGIAAAAPTDLMFEYLSDGADMRPETLYQAGSESFFIGGSFAAGGGAFMGTKKRMRELSIGDEINFRRDLTDPRQKALFEAIPAGTRRAISTYAIANPTLNYTFKDSGASRYDPNTNTAVINVNSTNPIKALVAHETLHHTVIKNNMEPGIAALFLGDTKNNTVGGLFRSRDGKLDPNFEAFRDGYYKRLGVEGMSNAERDAIYPLDKIAVEYFIEKHADQYAAMAESGELGAVASSGAAGRKLGSILETVLPRIPVLKDLHFKSGGMIDKNGAWVTGNGILDADGVKRDPITSKMFRDMNRRSAGLVPGQFDPLMSDKPDSGAPILLNPSDSIDAELLHPLVQVDDANKPIMKDGKPVALDRATELSRALAGLTAVEVMRRKRAENYAPEKGEAHVDDEGQFQPGWLSNDVITEMFAKNKYNPEQKRIIREMNKLIRKGAGDRVVMINFPATTRNKAGKVVYKPQGATLRDTVPVAVTISKDGNLLFGLMSVTKLHENIQKRSQDRRGKKLYGGNVDLILRDTQAMMDYHKQGLDSIEFFKQKYGAVEADERKKFINTMFGLLNKKEQAVLNPMLLEDGIKSKDNVYRTYRADRVSKAVPMAPEEYAAMPFSYEAVSQVRMPEAQRAMPEGISPEDLNPVANAQEAQGRWADGKQMFAINEMDEKLIPITSKAMLESYPADAIGWMEPEAQTRFMPEGATEPWRMTKKEFFHPQISRKFIQAESAKDGTIIGTIGDVVHGEKTRAILSPVLDVPIMIIRTPVQEGKKIVAGDKYDFDGASGTFQGKPTIFINPNKRMVGTLWEEAAHQMRRAKGRNIRKADIRKIIDDDRAFENEYKNDPEEISAKKLSNYLGSLASKEKSHREIVMNAVEAGLPVPKNVLSEYGVTENQTGQMRFMPEKDVDGDKGVSAPIGSLGELRKNVEIKSSNLPTDTKSVPKFVARTGKDDPWKVMDGPLRILKGNYLTPLPNIKVEKTKDFSVQNQDLIGNALSASQAPSNDPKEVKKQQVAAANVLDSLEKINSAVQDIENDPFKFVDTRGYAEIMKKSGVAGDVLIPPSSLRIMLNDPDAFAALLSGGYHGDKTVPGIRESAMSGLDAVVEMRDLIKGRPPELITALHHLWGTLSKQLPPLQQEALWMRMIVNKKVMDQIKASIDGTFNLTPDQWKNIVSSARTETVGTYGKLGENATSNANSFYLMLSKHNGRWNEVSDVYQNSDPVKMRYAFNTLGHGATGIKNKVQSFIGLTFGIKGNVLDRWRFVDMYLDDAMKLTGAKTPREYFKYEGKSKNVPVDKIGIYKNYGTLENNQSLFSLMLYSAMDRVSQIAIDSSPAMQKLLGNHADPGGLHWLSWNAIKNEAVGHSSLDITKNFIKKYASDGDFSKLTSDNFLKFVNNTEAFVEGTSGAGDEITRLTLSNGVFNYSKR